MRVTERGETDSARNLKGTSWSLGIGSEEEMQEEGIDLKNKLLLDHLDLDRYQIII